MEKCVDSDYPEKQYDSSKSSETWTDFLSKNSRDNKHKRKSKESVKVPRARKKIAGEKRSVGRSDPGKNVANAGTDKLLREECKRGTKLNVLKSRSASVKNSVQNNTKILQSNVPDRLGKYVNSSVRSETKLSLRDCHNSEVFPSNDRSPEEGTDSVEESNIGFFLNECPETKLNMIGNECLSNEESVALGNNFESDSETKNIFEKFFDDCLGSTSVVKEASSQETLNLETDDESVAINPKTVEKYTRLLENFENFKKDDARMIDNEKTPLKRNRSQNSPSTPVKIKDHNNYYSHKKIRHVCGYCHKIFKSNGKLNSHVYSHTGERPFDCNNCGKAFSSKFKLVRHLLIHSEIRKFVCQICDRTFLRNDHLKNHYKIHDPQKKMYKCPKEHCDKEYSSMMSHKKHMAYHSVEEGDLKCLICNIKFETKEDVLFHLKSHSGSRLFKSQSDKKFKCDFCDRLFLTRKDVTRHLVVHTGERDFLCQFCPQRFGRKDHLVRHIKKSHVSEGVPLKTEMKQTIDQKEDKKVNETTTNSKEIEQNECKRESSTSTTRAGKVTAKKKEEINTPEIEPSEEEQSEEAHRKTHIVITVKNPIQKRKWKSSESQNKNKSFRKSDSSVPNRKQVPLSKSKSSTTQIFLQNIPNILIIPNNSIILLRNQSGSGSKSKKVAEANENNNGSSSNNTDSNDNNNNININNNSNNSSDSISTASNVPPLDNRFQFNEDFLGGPRPMSNPNVGEDNTSLQSDCNFNMNYNYNSNMYQLPQFGTGFPFPGDTYCNFQSEIMPFGHQFENLNFETITQNDLLKRSDGGNLNLVHANESAAPTCPNGDNTFAAVSTEAGLLTEAQAKLLDAGSGSIVSCHSSPVADMQRKVGIVKPMTKTLAENSCEIDKDLFEDASENLIMSDSILNDFKVDDSVILPLDNENGILNNIFNQPGIDTTGNELLRNLLMSENPILSPLPGFSQIFHNSNTN